MVGHAAHQDSFKKLSIDEDTIVIAVTSNDEVNIIACQIAKKQFNAKKLSVDLKTQNISIIYLFLGQHNRHPN